MQLRRSFMHFSCYSPRVALLIANDLLLLASDTSFLDYNWLVPSFSRLRPIVLFSFFVFVPSLVSRFLVSFVRLPYVEILRTRCYKMETIQTDPSLKLKSWTIINLLSISSRVIEIVINAQSNLSCEIGIVATRGSLDWGPRSGSNELVKVRQLPSIMRLVSRGSVCIICRVTN